MKTIRVIAAIVLLACAGAAAYYSYSAFLAPPPLISTRGGPPAGISMPSMKSSSAGENQGDKGPQGTHRKSTDQRERADPEKGGDKKQH
jgi:hypothetical protein